MKRCILPRPAPWILGSFADCGHTDILDTHATPHARHPCQNQTLLVEALAEGLWLYERERISDESTPQDREHRTTEILWRLYDMLGDYKLLQRKRPLPGTLVPLRMERIQAAYATITSMARAIIVDARHTSGRHHKSRRRLQLYDYMRSVFRLFGPLEYSNTAVHSALAHILMTLGVEDGAESAVVTRIGQRLKRFDRS